MEKIKIALKKIKPNAIIPTWGSQYAAGCDLYACLDKKCYIKPGETIKIGTGLSIAPPQDTWLGIFARSGLATKQGLRPANCTGVIDSDYRGEIIVAVHNDSNKVREINHGDRIAQMILFPHYKFYFNEVTNLSETNRGEGGFGSTGK